MAEAKVNPMPPQYRGVTPYIYVRGASRAIEFYKRAFGAKEIYRIGMPDGRLGHAELEVGGGRFMLADEMPEMGAKSPQLLGGTTAGLLFYVPDVDAFVKNAVANGATVERPVANQFYGDRSGVLADPFGHKWNVATHVEDVSDAELQKRMANPPKPS